MYDYPAMNVAEEAQTVTPYRMSYGIDEYSLNGSNVAAARGGNDDPFLQGILGRELSRSDRNALA